MSNRSLHRRALGAVTASGLLALGPAPAAGAAELDPTVFETVPPGEAAQIEATARIMTELQDKRRANDATQNGNLLRGVHPKSHGCVKATFTVNASDSLDEKYRVGLLAQPGKSFDALIRYSNAAALREADLKGGANGSRGMALKVLDVDGEFLDLDHGRKNQDFLLINTTRFAFPDVHNYLRLNRVLLESSPLAADATPFFKVAINSPPADADPRKWQEAWKDFGAAELAATKSSGQVVGEIASRTVRNPLEVQYFGAAPFQFGPDMAMKYSVAPVKAVEQKPFDDDEKTKLPDGYLRKALTASLEGKDPILLEFKIQVRSRAELATGEIEDATTTWGPNEVENYVSVARISIPSPQEPDSQPMIELCEQLAFTPWHSLAAHRPIGGINRVRQKVYHASAGHRGANGY